MWSRMPWTWNHRHLHATYFRNKSVNFRHNAACNSVGTTAHKLCTHSRIRPILDVFVEPASLCFGVRGSRRNYSSISKATVACCKRPFDTTEQQIDRGSLSPQGSGVVSRGSGTVAAVAVVGVDLDTLESGQLGDARQLKGATKTPGGGGAGGIPGWVWLLLVAFLWGTYAPALRFLYSLPGAPSPAALLFVRTVIGASSLMLVDKLFHTANSGSNPIRGGDHGSIHMAATQQGFFARLINSTFGFVWLGGMELGLLKFLGEAFQAVGLTHSTAIRGAFLIQATALFTPLIAALGGDRLTGQIVLGGLTAVAGTCLMTLTQQAAAGDATHHMTLMAGGDAAILVAAFFYSLSTVRLSKYAVQYSPVRLAAWKTLASAGVATAWLVADCIGAWSSGLPLLSLWPGWQNPWGWLATAWLALGPGATATYAQLRGQSQVPAAQSQILYSTVPVWSAILAVTLLADESAGWAEWVGGGLIVVASLITVKPSYNTQKTGKVGKGEE